MFCSAVLCFFLTNLDSQLQDMESEKMPTSMLANLGEPIIGLSSCSSMRRIGSNGGSGSPPIRLGLELGCGGSDSDNRNYCKQTAGGGSKNNSSCCGFTILQLQELQLQSLIYKYIEAGIQVPIHLVLPIWKSVASSLNGINVSSLHQLYPAILWCSPLRLEYNQRLEMELDPEPGRCRRTDGKRWRCSKESLPHQKYCHRHMHRGRRLPSRKLVEPPPPPPSATS